MNRLRKTYSDEVLRFGPFHYYVQRRLVVAGNRQLRMGSRALEILQVLLENAGSVVSKEAIIARVWPTTVVEDSNLRVHIAALRRALGDGQGGQRYIANIPLRGYSFVADVQPGEAADPEPLTHAESPHHNLPPRLSQVTGRDQIVNSLLQQLPVRRFMTVVGPGGVGKTSVALRTAELLLAHYRDGVRFIDLAALADPSLVAAKVASSLGLPVLGLQIVASLSLHLRNRHMLLVLDNCEHLIDSCAFLAEGLLKRVPGLAILATSREPLLAEGEFVQRLPALDIPSPWSAPNAEEALAYSAVQLFVSRAAECQAGFTLRDRDVPAVAEICRRLDGMPLAIELAAAQVDGLGLPGLRTLLDNGAQLLMAGRRTALPRQRTLRAMLDWSHALLSPVERTVLQRLAVFKVAFTLCIAVRVIGCETLSESCIFEAITQLVAKSLLSVEIVNGMVHYRLLATTRAYALGKLRECGEFQALQERYARHRNIHVIVRDRAP